MKRLLKLGNPKAVNPKAAEIEKLKELKRLKFFEKIKILAPQFQHRPEIGDFISGRKCPAFAKVIDEELAIFLIVDSPSAEVSDYLWVPRLDDLIEISRVAEVSFSQITDYLHRRRFADGKETEGVLQLLIEKYR